MPLTLVHNQFFFSFFLKRVFLERLREWGQWGTEGEENEEVLKSDQVLEQNLHLRAFLMESNLGSNPWHQGGIYSLEWGGGSLWL